MYLVSGLLRFAGIQLTQAVVKELAEILEVRERHGFTPSRMARAAVRWAGVATSQTHAGPVP